MSLRVGQDRRHSLAADPPDQFLRVGGEEFALPVEFQQSEFPAVPEVAKVAPLEFAPILGRIDDLDLRPRHDRERDRRRPQLFVEPGDGRDDVAPEQMDVAVAVGRRHDAGYAVGDVKTRHRECFFQRLSTVVNSRQDVAMEVEQRRALRSRRLGAAVPLPMLPVWLFVRGFIALVLQPEVQVQQTFLLKRASDVPEFRFEGLAAQSERGQSVVLVEDKITVVRQCVGRSDESHRTRAASKIVDLFLDVRLALVA